MATQGSTTNKKGPNQRYKNPLETTKGFGSSGIFDQFFGSYDRPAPRTEQGGFGEYGKVEAPKKKKEFMLFNYQEHYEKEIVRREIKELTEEIKKEIELLKKADSSLLSEVKDIQKISLDSLPDKPGVYHIRFLELVLSILRTLRAKVGESRTWLQALMSKKKKRGSLFASLSKKKGTQYSLSQELQSSRSVQ